MRIYVYIVVGVSNPKLGLTFHALIKLYFTTVAYFDVLVES